MSASDRCSGSVSPPIKPSGNQSSLSCSHGSLHCHARLCSLRAFTGLSRRANAKLLKLLWILEVNFPASRSKQLPLATAGHLPIMQNLSESQINPVDRHRESVDRRIVGSRAVDSDCVGRNLWPWRQNPLAVHFGEVF